MVVLNPHLRADTEQYRENIWQRESWGHSLSCRAGGMTCCCSDIRTGDIKSPYDVVDPRSCARPTARDIRTNQAEYSCLIASRLLEIN
mgnify:CR=1 FL=1